jgi:hypothetical protein
MWYVSPGSTICDLTVSVLHDHMMIRQATASGSFHAPSVSSNCECRFVTIRYDPLTGKLFGRSTSAA